MVGHVWISNIIIIVDELKLCDVVVDDDDDECGGSVLAAAVWENYANSWLRTFCCFEKAISNLRSLPVQWNMLPNRAGISGAKIWICKVLNWQAKQVLFPPKPINQNKTRKSRDEIQSWKCGERQCENGKILQYLYHCDCRLNCSVIHAPTLFTEFQQ